MKTIYRVVANCKQDVICFDFKKMIDAIKFMDVAIEHIERDGYLEICKIQGCDDEE